MELNQPGSSPYPSYTHSSSSTHPPHAHNGGQYPPGQAQFSGAGDTALGTPQIPNTADRTQSNNCIQGHGASLHPGSTEQGMVNQGFQSANQTKDYAVVCNVDWIAPYESGPSAEHISNPNVQSTCENSDTVGHQSLYG